MALKLSIGEPTITTYGEMCNAAVTVTVLDDAIPIVSREFAASVNKDHATLEAVLVANLKAQILAYQAEIEIQRTKQASLVTLKAALETALATP